jgi:hypothetical protein
MSFRCRSPSPRPPLRWFKIFKASCTGNTDHQPQLHLSRSCATAADSRLAGVPGADMVSRPYSHQWIALNRVVPLMATESSVNGVVSNLDRHPCRDQSGRHCDWDRLEHRHSVMFQRAS